ncbi:hypothetical protein D9619_009680 [Psilocybe cf. subviscida]|uniref:Uncharacterized protein n=1 Tax=Psilocybe cf. subviscida TaxID=2480587 RepID=A0A8H5BLT3_9AGAR|nr:hypothetical protein D9619_009680 [Psilocybe cf. subviscida]
MASLASTVPRYLFLTLQIYVLRSFLLALSAIDLVVEVTLCIISAFKPSVPVQSSPEFTLSQRTMQPHIEKRNATDAEDAEESYFDSDFDDVADSSEIYPCESTVCLVEDTDAVVALGLDLEFLIGALAEGIQSFADRERLLVQSENVDSSVRSSSSGISLLGSASMEATDANEYSAVVRPHTPKRFSLRIESPSMRFWKHPTFDLGANFDTDFYGASTLISLSRRDRLTSLDLSTSNSATSDTEEVSLSPALLWAPNLTKVKVVLALPLKRTRRRKATSVVIWSNQGEYGDLKKVLEEVGR